MAVVKQRDTYTALKVQPELFSDFLSSFGTHSIKRDLLRNVNDEAVKTSIKNLLQTNRGERFFNTNIGSDIRSLLFEPNSPATAQVLEDLIRTMISNYEPRARVEDVRVTNDEEGHSMTATIIFSVINRETPIVLEVLLNRIR